MKRWGNCTKLDLEKSLKFFSRKVTVNTKVDMVLDEAGIDGDGKFRYNDFVDRLNSDN